jgi:serine/threonine protein kinase
MKIPETIPWVPTGKTLGSGGQAEVYLVTRRDQSDSRNFALKVLKHVDSKQARDRFAREIEAVKILDSPFIAKIIDHSKPEDSFQYYTMEYYEGARSLANIVFSGLNPFHGNTLKCLDIFESLVMCIQACELAKPQIIHRDINPKNILVLPDGSIRLIDFGICQIQDGQVLTLVDEDVGTRNYTAPECESGNDTEIGIHSDLYSAGKVLWSSITSQRAFAREKPVFGNRGLDIMFPNNPLTWHLNLIFEKTIRANPQNRLSKTETVLKLIQEVRYLVERGFPPMEEIAKRCPSCGRSNVGDFPLGYTVFGNPNPQGVQNFLCKDCGFGFVRNVDYLRDNYQRFLNSE